MYAYKVSRRRMKKEEGRGTSVWFGLLFAGPPEDQTAKKVESQKVTAIITDAPQ